MCKCNPNFLAALLREPAFPATLRYRAGTPRLAHPRNSDKRRYLNRAEGVSGGYPAVGSRGKTVLECTVPRMYGVPSSKIRSQKIEGTTNGCNVTVGRDHIRDTQLI